VFIAKGRYPDAASAWPVDRRFAQQGVKAGQPVMVQKAFNDLFGGHTLN
jgi:hypothetical protein